MRLRYAAPALADLEAILDYVDRRSPQGAARVKARIQTIIDLLLTHPLMGVQTSDPSIRRVTTTPYPYLVFYEPAAEEIIIHAVRHASRRPSTAPDPDPDG